MNIDIKQLHYDKQMMRETLPTNDNEAWDAWDRIAQILEAIEDEQEMIQRR